MVHSLSLVSSLFYLTYNLTGISQSPVTGELILSDTSNNLLRYYVPKDSLSVTQLFSPSLGRVRAIRETNNGDIYFTFQSPSVAYNGVWRIRDNVKEKVFPIDCEVIQEPHGLAFDGSLIYVSDSYTGTIWLFSEGTVKGMLYQVGVTDLTFDTESRTLYGITMRHGIISIFAPDYTSSFTPSNTYYLSGIYSSHCNVYIGVSGRFNGYITVPGNKVLIYNLCDRSYEQTGSIEYEALGWVIGLVEVNGRLYIATSDRLLVIDV